MKNILATAAAAFLLVTSTGCSGFLDEELKSSLSPDNTYTSSYGFEVGVNGLYGWARSEFNTWGGATTSQGQACPWLVVAPPHVLNSERAQPYNPFTPTSKP